MPKESITTAGEKRQLLLSSEDSREIEFEIELPGIDPGGIFSFLICESQAQLDNFQQVNVTPKELVLIVYGVAEFSNRPYNNSRKLRVLGEKGKAYCITRSIRSHYYHSIWSLLSSTFTGLSTAFPELFCKNHFPPRLFHIHKGFKLLHVRH